MKKQVLVCGVALGMVLVIAGCKEKAEPEAAAQPVDSVTTEEPTAQPMDAVMTEEVSVSDEAASEVVVSVNGETLSRADVERQMQQVLGSPQFASMPPEQASMIMQQVQGQIVNQFIDQALLRGAADAADVTVTDEEIDTYIAELREYFAGGESLEARMAMQGISMEDLRRDIVADMRIRALLDQMTAEVADADEEQIRAHYDENREMFAVPASVSAKHILIQVERDADDEARAAARAKLSEIREKLLAGEIAFETAASEHSSCPSSQRGGDLGQFARGQMVPAFEEAAFTQPIGEVGEIVETDFGYHLILVSDRQEATEQSFEDVKDDIAEQLVMGEKQEMVQAYIARLREEADIQFAE